MPVPLPRDSRTMHPSSRPPAQHPPTLGSSTGGIGSKPPETEMNPGCKPIRDGTHKVTSEADIREHDFLPVTTCFAPHDSLRPYSGTRDKRLIHNERLLAVPYISLVLDLAGVEQTGLRCGMGRRVRGGPCRVGVC